MLVAVGSNRALQTGVQLLLLQRRQQQQGVLQQWPMLSSSSRWISRLLCRKPLLRLLLVTQEQLLHRQQPLMITPSKLQLWPRLQRSNRAVAVLMLHSLQPGRLLCRMRLCQ
jgi:hypothetical protein